MSWTSGTMGKILRSVCCSTCCVFISAVQKDGGVAGSQQYAGSSTTRSSNFNFSQSLTNYMTKISYSTQLPATRSVNM